MQTCKGLKSGGSSHEQLQQSLIIAWIHGVLSGPCKHRTGSSTAVFCFAQVMIPLLRPGTDTTLLQNTEDNLHAFSVKGLRTLVVGSKVCWQIVQSRV